MNNKSASFFLLYKRKIDKIPFVDCVIELFARTHFSIIFFKFKHYILNRFIKMSAPKENNQSEDKKDIEIEEREKILNAENKMHEVIIESTDSDNKDSKLKAECREGREVKPKKIPIGGIQMPGFFTRSRSKEKCKEGETEQETEGLDLLQDDDKEKKDDSLLSQTRIKLPNPFRKSKTDEDGI